MPVPLFFLSSLKNLRKLQIEEPKATGSGFKYIAGLTNLEEFSYSPYDSGIALSEHVQHLRGLKKLKRLTLRFCAGGSKGLDPIGELTNLEFLELYSCEIKSHKDQYSNKTTRTSS